MTTRRRALTFCCDGSRLVGVVHLPSTPSSIGVVVVVGGPQYRIGSHRQFVRLADDLASAGHTTLRFDYRGMGDSEGPYAGFEGVDADIGAAIAALRREQPAIDRVVLWGLCDAATAAAFYAASAANVSGLVLANPWVRTTDGLARSYIRNYYGQRLRDPKFWRGLFSGEVPVIRRVREYFQDLRLARRRASTTTPESLPERVRGALASYQGPVLLILSSADLTAGEFVECLQSPAWGGWGRSPQVTRVDVAAADHTFSTAEAYASVAKACTKWLGMLAVARR